MLKSPPRAAERYLTVPELADLLRIKERKVYDLAASGAVPCSKVTGILLFPENAVHRWLARGQTGEAEPDTARPIVFLGSHDPLLEWALRQSECGIATFFDGSQDGLERFSKREGLAAGIHIFEPESGLWNTPAMARFRGEPVVLLSFATRTRGLVIRRNLSSAIKSITDLADHKVTPRQDGAGTRILFDHLLSEAGVSIDTLRLAPVARSEADAVLDVSTEASDVTFGLEVLARQHQLGFVPLVEERFDILVSRRAYFDVPMQRFMRFLSSKAFADHAAAMAGYDVSDAGAVRWNG